MILDSLGGPEEVEAYLASAEEALASAEAEGDAEDGSESEQESEEDVPEETHSGLGKRVGELLLALVVVVVIGWWLGTRFLAMREELAPIAQRVAEDKAAKDEAKDTSDHGDRKAAAARSKKAKRKAHRKRLRPNRPWEAWKITRDESTKIRVDDEWDLSDQSPPRRLQVLRTQGGPITLSRTEKFLPEHRWLVVDARPEKPVLKAGSISVHLDGQEVLVHPIGTGTALWPVYIELPSGAPREVSLVVKFTAGQPDQQVHAPRLASVLAGDLLSTDVAVRRKAFQTIRSKPGQPVDRFAQLAAVAVLNQALNQEDEQLRHAAAEFAHGHAGEISEAAMLAAINGHTDPNVRRMAITRFQSHPSSKAVEPLRKVLAGEDESLRKLAASSLDKIPGPESTAALVEALKHSDINIRRMAVKSFQTRSSPARQR